MTNFFRGALQPPPDGPPARCPEALEDEEPEPGFEVISCVSTWGAKLVVTQHGQSLSSSGCPERK